MSIFCLYNLFIRNPRVELMVIELRFQLHYNIIKCDTTQISLNLFRHNNNYNQFNWPYFPISNVLLPNTSFSVLSNCFMKLLFGSMILRLLFAYWKDSFRLLPPPCSLLKVIRLYIIQDPDRLMPCWQWISTRPSVEEKTFLHISLVAL